MADTQSNTEKSEKQDDPMKNYEFDGQTYIYTDKATNITYKFDQENTKWVVKDDNVSSDNKESSNRKEKKENSGPEVSSAGTFGFENDTHTYTDPNDGSVYFWDKEKNAWFPKVDQDFMARYQMNYGFADTSAPQPNPSEPKQPTSLQKAKEEKEQRRTDAKRKAQEPPTWFEVDEAHNTAIYVSGLPLNITMEELTELFTKCGLIARDERGKDKIKLYKDVNGEPKGDALCTYIKIESVDLALKILDGSQIRGKTLSVQRAKFQMKGAYDPALKPKRKKKDKERQKKMQEKLFDWRPDRMRGEPLKCERVVILKNLFTPEDFDRDVKLLLEYQQDIRSECLKCGDVRKVIIYDHGLLSLVSNLVISNDSSRLSRSRCAIDGIGGRVKEWCYSKGWCDVRVRKSAGQLWGAGPGRGDELLRCDVSILSLSLPDPPATAAASDPPPCGPAQSPPCQSTRGPPQPGQTGALSTLPGGYGDASV